MENVKKTTDRMQRLTMALMGPQRPGIPRFHRKKAIRAQHNLKQAKPWQNYRNGFEGSKHDANCSIYGHLRPDTRVVIHLPLRKP
jgi:hypothetical protein